MACSACVVGGFPDCNQPCAGNGGRRHVLNELENIAGVEGVAW